MLFVDAGYVLADGAMAVHGTRRRDSVSFDYPGLLKLLAGLSRDRTGLPLLRCYWYEATVQGRRTHEHDLLADLPGLKLRLGRMRPGHREGVETEIHRDLITLARNGAVCDAVIASAEEDLSQVIAEVQDLGVRVILLHITTDGTQAISQPLRQECDDIVEVSGAHLRPFVDLIAGAEPAGLDDRYPNGSYPERVLSNGHGANLGALTHRGLPAAALPPGGTIYTAPIVTEYQRAAQPPDPAAQGSPGQREPDAEDLADPPGFGYRQPGPAQGQDQGHRAGPRIRPAEPGGLHEQPRPDRGLPPSAGATAGLPEQAPATTAGLHGLHEQPLGRSGIGSGAAKAAPGHAQSGAGPGTWPGPAWPGPASPRRAWPRRPRRRRA